MQVDPETICAIATPTGRGGISIIRLSGSKSIDIAEKILNFKPTPRHAHYGPFFASNKNIIDSGISLFFPGPDSFTGEDIVEFQAHGGPFIVEILLEEITQMGIRIARPGEFSERAFLNDKIDLAQAEAIADLIDSRTREAAKFASRSLQGEFSKKINALADSLIELRMYIEASIDFPEEEVDFLSEGKVEDRLLEIQNRLQLVLSQAKTGSLMQEGLKVVIAGEPNAGKSSLLNALAGQDRAIVTEQAGTTRDTLQEQINIDGIPLHIIDTAGLRDNTTDAIEKEGMKRAWQQINDADQVLLVVDSTTTQKYETMPLWQNLVNSLDNNKMLCVVFNKIDLCLESESQSTSSVNEKGEIVEIRLSAKSGQGIDALKDYLKSRAGFVGTEEDGFIARSRHINAIKRADEFLKQGLKQLQAHKAGELLAEDLRESHQSLEEITGKFSSDDLLGKIFSSFCIGK